MQIEIDAIVVKTRANNRVFVKRRWNQRKTRARGHEIEDDIMRDAT